MKVAITGGSGFVGRRLIARLLADSHDVTVLSRTKAKAFPARVTVIGGDLTSPECHFEEFLGHADVLINCAGEVRVTAAMRPLHVDATQRLIDFVRVQAAHRRTPLHWVQLSSVGAYGPPAGAVNEERVVTEHTKTRPLGEYEVTKTLADEAIMRTTGSGSMSYSIVRPSNIFAADMPNDSLRALGAMVRKGLFFYVGPPGAIATYVHVDDVVETLVRCAFDDRAKGKVYNVSNDCHIEEMIGGLAAASGVKTPRLRLPERWVRVAAKLGGKIGRFPLTQERINALVMRTRYPYSRLETELGFTPRVCVPKAIGEVVSGATRTKP